MDYSCVYYLFIYLLGDLLVDQFYNIHRDAGTEHVIAATYGQQGTQANIDQQVRRQLNRSAATTGVKTAESITDQPAAH